MNEKMMKRTVYEAPVTELFRIELEGNFCGSADVENPNKDTGRIDPHEINTGFDIDADNSGYADGSWE